MCTPSWALVTTIHELTHAFRLGHMCGNWDYRGEDNSCVMNYNNHFILDDSSPRKPIPWTNRKIGIYLCPEHIKCMREKNLEDEVY